MWGSDKTALVLLSAPLTAIMSCTVLVPTLSNDSKDGGDRFAGQQQQRGYRGHQCPFVNLIHRSINYTAFHPHQVALHGEDWTWRSLVINDKVISVFEETDPMLVQRTAKFSWVFTTVEKGRAPLKGGAKKVMSATFADFLMCRVMGCHASILPQGMAAGRGGCGEWPHLPTLLSGSWR